MTTKSNKDSEQAHQSKPVVVDSTSAAQAPAASGGDNCEDCQIHRQAHHSLDNIVIGAGVFEVLYEGGVEPAWKNTIEAVKKLANPPAAASVSERARALLAAEFARAGMPFNAADCARGEVSPTYEPALRAIEQALTQQRGDAVAEVRKGSIDNFVFCPDPNSLPVGTKLYTTPHPDALPDGTLSKSTAKRFAAANKRKP